MRYVSIAALALPLLAWGCIAQPGDESSGSVDPAGKVSLEANKGTAFFINHWILPKLDQAAPPSYPGDPAYYSPDGLNRLTTAVKLTIDPATLDTCAALNAIRLDSVGTKYFADLGAANPARDQFLADWDTAIQIECAKPNPKAGRR